MENEIAKKSDLIEKIVSKVKEKKKLIISTLFIFFIILSGVIFFYYYQDNQNEKISEKYIKAGIYLGSKDKEKSKIIYREIILSKNKFYSILALNNMIENDLVKESKEILNYFEIIENINITKEQKNLVKLKKALYFKKISRDIEGNELLKEIIADNSIWKETAIEAPK